WHLQVDQSHIGPELHKRLDGLISIRSFAHQLHIGVPMQHVSNPFEDQGMVVDSKDSNSIGAYRCCTHGVCSRAANWGPSQGPTSLKSRLFSEVATNGCFRVAPNRLKFVVWAMF